MLLFQRRDFAAEREPFLQRFQCKFSDRHHARFRAFAGNTHLRLMKIHIAHFQPRQLREPQAGGIKQFQHGRVADGEWGILVRHHEVRRDIGRERCGQFFLVLGRFEAETRVVDEAVIACQITIQSAPGGKHARQRLAAQAAPVQQRHKTPHLMDL